MASFYVNENFPFPIVEELRRVGDDVLTTLQAGRANKRVPDDQVLAFATLEGRAVLTLNRRDFIKLHKQHPTHAGIIACTVDADYAGLANRILAQVAAAGSLAGQLLRVTRNP